jgi:hypothetical protein
LKRASGHWTSSSQQINQHINQHINKLITKITYNYIYFTYQTLNKSKMRASVIAAILTFTASAIAAPVAAPVAAPTNYYTVPEPSTDAPTVRSIFGKRSSQQALADCGSNTQCQNVVNTIIDWDTSVNQVNDFLNNGGSQPNPAVTNSEQNALNFANKEPGFLATLQGTPGLDAAGQAAASTLGQVFPAVPQNLQTLLNSGATVQQGIDNINNVRCPSILGNISQLWISAAAAVGADTPGGALGPLTCEKPGGNVNDAYN